MSKLKWLVKQVQFILLYFYWCLSVNASESLYMAKVKPILDNRCVACHSCYNAPCQLKLSSFEGLTRGASKQDIYQQTVFQKDLSRLYIDAKNDQEWRDKGFFSVINENQDQENNILLSLVKQRKDFPIDGKFLSEESRSCPKDDKELKKFIKKNPFAGMPYGFPALQDNEIQVLEQWFEQGNPGPNETEFKSLTQTVYSHGEETIAKWTKKFNGTSIKDQLANRYLYEKLFLAHIHFEEMPGEFYRMVRSTTDYPVAIDEIPTQRPYDNPGSNKFYYRFVKVQETIMHKTHIVFEFNSKLEARLDELFYKKTWKNEDTLTLPSYNIETASNPFITFIQIPADSRYQFMLDNAEFIIMNFIRGPVCKGQVALNVIRDHFWAMFIKPESDVSINSNSFMEKAWKDLDVPAKSENNPIFKHYREKIRDYTKFHAKALKEFRPDGYGIEDLWDGNGENTNAALTITRHFNSATVRKGHLGQLPKTIWILDYPIFERIWYDLVAGFSPYGSILHQTATRRYMDTLRVESEDLFLSMLPIEVREEKRKDFYQGKLAQIKLNNGNPFRLRNYPTKVEYSKDVDPVRSFVEQSWKRLGNAVVKDKINCCATEFTKNEPKLIEPIKSKEQLELAFSDLSKNVGEYIQYIHEVTFLKVKLPNNEEVVYTILRNNEHKFMNYMLIEGKQRDPSNDTLNIYPGFVGSYPNFFMTVELENAHKFLFDLQKITSKQKAEKFQRTYGINRDHPEFWSYYDFFNKKFKEIDPLNSGLFDLNRYEEMLPAKLIRSEDELEEIGLMKKLLKVI